MYIQWNCQTLLHMIILTHTQLVFPTCFQRSGGSIVPAAILRPSECGADCWTLIYERSGTMVPHDCAPVARMSIACVPTPP